MTTVQITPDVKPAAPAQPQSEFVTDSTGRRLKIEQPNILNESRLVCLLGEAAANQVYMTAYVLPAVMVTQIDDDPVPFPVNRLQIDAQIQVLGRHGLKAVMDHITAQADAAANPEDGVKK